MHLNTQNSFSTIAKSANEELTIRRSDSGNVGRYGSLNTPRKDCFNFSFIKLKDLT